MRWQPAILCGSYEIAVWMPSVRSPSASAIRMTPIPGNGAAVFIRARIQANTSPTPLRPSTMPARISNARGRCSYRTAPRPIFRNGAMREIGPNGNMRCGTLASGWSRQAMDRASQPIDSANALAVRSSTCTAPRRCWCTFPTLLRRGQTQSGTKFARISQP